MAGRLRQVATGIAGGGVVQLARGAGVGAVLDFKSANDQASDSVAAFDALLAANPGDIAARAQAIAQLRQEAQTLQDKVRPEGFLDKITAGAHPETFTDTVRRLLGMQLDPVSSLTGAFEDNAATAQDQATNIQNAIDAMKQQRSETARNLHAQLNYEAAIDDANKAVKDNGRTADKTTEKGRANLAALHSAEANFVSTATQMVFTAAQARNLAERLL